MVCAILSLFLFMSNCVILIRSSATLGRVPRSGRARSGGRGPRLGWAEAGSVSSEDILGLGDLGEELYYQGYRPGRRVKRTESFV